MNRLAGAALLAGALVITGAADAKPAPPPLVTRRVDIEMRDTVFAPAALEVKAGETITFVFTNTGKQTHDAFIGDKAAQEHHEEEMQSRKDPNDHHGHEGGVIVKPGEQGSFRYFFDKPGTLEIGCHQPYHYDLGMKVVVEVVPGVPPLGTSS